MCSRGFVGIGCLEYIEGKVRKIIVENTVEKKKKSFIKEKRRKFENKILECFERRRKIFVEFG